MAAVEASKRTGMRTGGVLTMHERLDEPLSDAFDRSVAEPR
jgi:hypothetical protein